MLGTANMGLKLNSVWTRLKTLLFFHDKLRAENRDKKRLDETARKIRHLTYLLEKYNGQAIESANLDD